MHNVILSRLPHPPRFSAEIEEILEEGLVSDTGAFVVEAMGKKDGTSRSTYLTSFLD